MNWTKSGEIVFQPLPQINFNDNQIYIKQEIWNTVFNDWNNYNGFFNLFTLFFYAIDGSNDNKFICTRE